MIQLPDFCNSSLTWVVKINSNPGYLSHGKFSLESIHSRIEKSTGNEIVVYVLSGVMAGNVYAERNLPKIPSYRFQAIFSDSGQYKIFRTYASSSDDTFGLTNDRFEDLKLDIRHTKGEQISTNFREEDLVSKQLVACIETSGEHIESKSWFPIKHINWRKMENHIDFQVETGPVICIKDAPGNDINSLEVGYVYFNNFHSFDQLSGKWMMGNNEADLNRDYVSISSKNQIYKQIE